MVCNSGVARGSLEGTIVGIAVCIPVGIAVRTVVCSGDGAAKLTPPSFDSPVRCEDVIQSLGATTSMAWSSGETVVSFGGVTSSGGVSGSVDGTSVGVAVGAVVCVAAVGLTSSGNFPADCPDVMKGIGLTTAIASSSTESGASVATIVNYVLKGNWTIIGFQWTVDILPGYNLVVDILFTFTFTFGRITPVLEPSSSLSGI